MLRQIGGGAAGLIVILDDIGQKTNILNLQLGFDHGLLPLGEHDRLRIVPPMFPSRQQMGGKIEHGGKMAVFSHKFL